MPAAVYVAQVGFAQALYAKLRYQVVERCTVQPIQRGPRLLAFAHLVHRRVIRGAPCIDQRSPIRVDAALAPERSQFRDQAAAPIHHGTKGIEHYRDRSPVCHDGSSCLRAVARTASWWQLERMRCVKARAAGPFMPTSGGARRN